MRLASATTPFPAVPLPPIQPVILTSDGRRQIWVQALQEAFTNQPGFLAPLVHQDLARAGAARATQQAIQLATRQAAGTPILLLEDDVQPHPEMPGKVLQVQFPHRVAVISFCDMREVEEYARDGLYELSALGSDGRGWWGNQALLIHPETAAVLAATDWFTATIEQARGVVVHRVAYEDGGLNCADIRLSLIVHHQPHRNRYAVHVPSLFLHLGHESLCFPGRSMGERATRNWLESRSRYGIN